ncbi:MAG: ATP-binding protein [Planctomycetota bacterium]
MRRGALMWRMATLFLLLLLLGLASLALLAFEKLETAAASRQTEALHQGLTVAVPQFARALASDNLREAMTRSALDLSRTLRADVLVLHESGKWIGVRAGMPDTTSGTGAPDGYMERGLNGESSLGQEHSPGFPARIYVCVPVRDGSNHVVGAAEVRQAVTAASAPYQTVAQAIGWIVLIALVGFTIAVWLVWGLLSRLRVVRLGVERMARGDLTARLRLPEASELHSLVSAINHMASQLDERLQALARHYNQQQAVFASMEEGVIAVDHTERVISLNAAAATLAQVASSAPEGRPYYEVLHLAALQRFVADTLESREPIERDIELIGSADRLLRCHGTLLRDTDGRNVGAVIVLHDITRLRQLEDMRRDFVANVSHELRTPVTSIKGSAETLLDGAVNNPTTAQRFLGIIVRHADRLSAIIEDLLSLSRLEQDGQDNLRRERVPLARVLRNVADLCAPRCKGHQIQLDCTVGLEVDAAPHLLEQAVLNLVDNAIKYSPTGGTITMRGVLDGDEIALSVIDQGPGIPAEHIPRLFERFYRVDKGRSRLVGGTGLGLAIVKHIVQAHGGRVEADSTPGVGSTFTIRLPHVRRHAAVAGTI